MSVLEATVGGVRVGVVPDPLPAIGAVGMATGPLRPSGRVTIGDEPFDAVSSQGFIDAGTPVRVTAHRSGTIVVERVP
jgi:membrane-bound ClpP family serine protease